MGSVGLDREIALETFWYFASFIMGLVFGSFGNVVIWRLPRGESLSVPASHCPVCETPIAWYDNVPILSWLVLLGRCRSCGAPISVRYPSVELLSGLLWMAAVVHFGPSVQAAVCVFFFYVLMLLAFIDVDTMRLPNSLVGLLALVGLAGLAITQLSGVLAVPLMPLGDGALAIPWVFSLVGAVVSAGTVLAIALVYARVRGTDGFGMGDIKLLLVIGLFLGPYGLLVLVIGSFIGAFYGVIASRRSPEGMRHKFPFGPFLALSAVVVTLVGVPLVAWYVGLLAR
jgi:leader peptidase (prepilin peptidase)/N-methyltransferase